MKPVMTLAGLNHRCPPCASHRHCRSHPRRAPCSFARSAKVQPSLWNSHVTAMAHRTVKINVSKAWQTPISVAILLSIRSLALSGNMYCCHFRVLNAHCPRHRSLSLLSLHEGQTEGLGEASWSCTLLHQQCSFRYWPQAALYICKTGRAKGYSYDG